MRKYLVAALAFLALIFVERCAQAQGFLLPGITVPANSVLGNNLPVAAGGNSFTFAQLQTLLNASGVNGAFSNSVAINGATSGSATFNASATGGHVSITGGTAPALTAGCNGAGSSISGNDVSGTVTGQTAAATTCTLTFGTAFGATPHCILTGEQSAILTSTPAAATLVATFASTANFKFDYLCLGT